MKSGTIACNTTGGEDSYQRAKDYLVDYLECPLFALHEDVCGEEKCIYAPTEAKASAITDR